MSSLLVARYSLLVTGYSLLVTRCSLLVGLFMKPLLLVVKFYVIVVFSVHGFRVQRFKGLGHCTPKPDAIFLFSSGIVQTSSIISLSMLELKSSTAAGLV